MRNYMLRFFVASVCLLTTPIIATASDKSLSDNTAIAEPDRGNFEKDTSDAADRLQEFLRMMRKDKFFAKLDKIVDRGDIKKAEELLDKQARDIPSYIDTGAYIATKSKIAYAKGDYPSAYAEADKYIAALEKHFAPQKPYEAVLKDKNDRDIVCYAYILRYQALAQMRRYDEALADLNRAQGQVETPELLRAKTGTLLALEKYAEAADTADKAFAKDKNIFVSSPYRDHYCWLFSEHGLNNVKACTYFAALAKERAEKGKAAQ